MTYYTITSSDLLHNHFLWPTTQSHPLTYYTITSSDLLYNHIIWPTTQSHHLEFQFTTFFTHTKNTPTIHRWSLTLSATGILRVDTSSAQSSVRDTNIPSRDSSRASTPKVNLSNLTNTTPSRRESRVKSLSLGENPSNPIPTDLVSREQVQNALLTQRTPLTTPRDHAPLAPLSSPNLSTLSPLDGGTSLRGSLGSLGGGSLLGSRSSTMLSSNGFGGNGPGSPIHMLSLKDGDGVGMGLGMGMGSPHASRRSSTG